MYKEEEEAMEWNKFNILFVLLFLTSIVFLGVQVEGKKKRKFEGDFEFADEEEETKLTSKMKKEGKKTWILDPGSDLCQALKCKNKKEFCLLEDEFTAVCVSKKELHKNGDIIIPKSKFKGNDGQKVSDLDGKNTKDYEDDDSDSDYYDEDDEDEDDVWSNENLDDFGKDKTSKSANSDLVEPLNIFRNNIKSCNACPVTKPTFLCASDNRTYSSLCRLDYHNCIQKSQITIACKGFCPCKGGENKSKIKSVFTSESAHQQDNEVPFIPTAAKDRYSKHKEYFMKKKTKSDRQRSFNDVLETKNILEKDCTDEALESMGNRLLDWFSVVFSDTLKRKLNRKTRNNQIRFPRDCKKEVQWMFNHLNTRDEDELLSIQELFDLENDRNEKCIKPFIDRCDTDKDFFVNSSEWCHCFSRSERPCSVIRKKSNKGLLGGYVPQCMEDGFYKSLQCHGSTGLCWCVDKHGVEFANTRTRGKLNCGSMTEKEENDLDDDEDSDFEGSGLEI